jgi:hypothetical protein
MGNEGGPSRENTHDRGAIAMNAALLEVITLPVSDVDRALRFCVDRVGFTLDIDYAPTDAFRVAQLTPPGSTCSIQLGIGLTDAPARSIRNTYLVVTDVEAAGAGLAERGVSVSEIRHKTPVGAWDAGFAPGPDPEPHRLRELRGVRRPRRQYVGAPGTRLRSTERELATALPVGAAGRDHRSRHQTNSV